MYDCSFEDPCGNDGGPGNNDDDEEFPAASIDPSIFRMRRASRKSDESIM